jgi:multidrug efflux pump subunit AcrB
VSTVSWCSTTSARSFGRETKVSGAEDRSHGGGLVSSTLLTLIVLPAIYLLWKRFSFRGELALAKTAH